MDWNRERLDGCGDQVSVRRDTANGQLRAELNAIGAPSLGCLCSLYIFSAQFKKKVLHKNLRQSPFFQELLSTNRLPS
jgi:hypothetical protein